MFPSRGAARARARAPYVSAAQSPIRRRRPRSSHRAGGRRRQHRAPRSPDIHHSPRPNSRKRTQTKFTKKNNRRRRSAAAASTRRLERVALLTTAGEPAGPSRAYERSERITRGGERFFPCREISAGSFCFLSWRPPPLLPNPDCVGPTAVISALGAVASPGVASAIGSSSAFIASFSTFESCPPSKPTLNFLRQ